MRLVVVRILLLALAALLTAGILSLLTDTPFSPALTPQLSALYFIPVNIVCFWLLARQGRVKTLLGERPYLRGSDFGYGLLWLFALFVPFAVAINLVVLLLFGPSGYLTGFETIFVPTTGNLLELPAAVSLVFAIIVAVLFPITNAPVEELYYRGHAQRDLATKGFSPAIVVLVPAVLFGLQHVFLAPTAAAMLVYVVAFTFWGAFAGIIYIRQGRLMPLIVAHFFTNLMTSVVPLVFILALTLPGGATVPVAGLTSVAVDPTRTGRGLGRDVLAARILILVGAALFAVAQIVPYWVGTELVSRGNRAA